MYEWYEILMIIGVGILIMLPSFICLIVLAKIEKGE